MMNGDKYFTEYENLEIHELMLRDKPRLAAYCQAIMTNAKMFKGKTVMDVGAGTGILSMFCAKAGAKLVYAIEASNLAKIAIEVVEDNKLTSIVKVIHTKVENFQLPEKSERIDIIVSEWMGFYLLHEGMLDSVIYARDAFLKPLGYMFPQYTSIYIAPCSVKSRFAEWENMQGLRMNKFAEKLRKARSAKPEVLLLDPEDLLHDGVIMSWMDLGRVTLPELMEITYENIVPAKKSGVHQGYCIWFECQFPGEDDKNSIILSTSPTSPATHWKQCVIVLPDDSCEQIEAKCPMAFRIIMRRQENNPRHYNLEVEILDASKMEHELPCGCYMTKCILAKAHLEKMEVDGCV